MWESEGATHFTSNQRWNDEFISKSKSLQQVYRANDEFNVNFMYFDVRTTHCFRFFSWDFFTYFSSLYSVVSFLVLQFFFRLQFSFSFHFVSSSQLTVSFVILYPHWLIHLPHCKCHNEPAFESKRIEINRMNKNTTKQHAKCVCVYAVLTAMPLAPATLV